MPPPPSSSQILSPPLSPFLSVTTAATTTQTPSPLPPLRASLKSSFPSPPALRPPSTCAQKITTLQSLQRAILSARHHARPIRVCTLSCNNPVLTHSQILHLHRGGVLLDLAPLHAVTLNHNRATVLAQAGASVHHLLDLVLKRAPDLSLPAHPPLADACIDRDDPEGMAMSVGAAFANGAISLGAGLAEGLFADAILSVSLVDASGRLRVYSRREGDDLFRAVSLALGLFGVVYDITLALYPVSKKVRVFNRFIAFDSLCTDSATRMMRRILADKCVGVELTWFPFNSFRSEKKDEEELQEWRPGDDLVWLRTLERVVSTRYPSPSSSTSQTTSKPTATREKKHLEDDDDRAFEMLTLPQWLNLKASQLAARGYTGYDPAHTKHYLSLAFHHTAWTLESPPCIQSLPQAVHYHRNATTFPVTAVAVAFPLRPAREEDWHNLHRSWRIVTDTVKQYDQRGEYPLNVSLKTNFVKSSRALLAPNFANTAPGKKNIYSAVVQISTARNTPGWLPFARHVVAHWMRLPGARLRLSRQLTAIVDPDVVVASLGDNLQEFISLRRNAAVDDVDLFLDDSLAEILGITPQRRDFSTSPVSSSGSCLSCVQVQDVDTPGKRSSKLERGTRERDMSSTDSGAGDHYLSISRTPSAMASQSSLTWTQHASTTQLFPSPVPSRTSLLEGSDAHSHGGYVRDHVATDFDFDDDGSLASDLSADVIPLAMYKRTPVRRKRVVRYQSPLTSPESSLLLAYIALYVLVWFAMFGPSALRQLGWFEQIEP